MDVYSPSPYCVTCQHAIKVTQTTTIIVGSGIWHKRAKDEGRRTKDEGRTYLAFVLRPSSFVLRNARATAMAAPPRARPRQLMRRRCKSSRMAVAALRPDAP